MPYYHASPRKIENMMGGANIITPNGFYEKIGRGGCPEPMFGDAMAGFKLSDVPEVAFSKKPEDAVFAEALNSPTTEMYIYETAEQPDADISDCGYDFGELSEVRYRRPVIVTPFAHLKLPKRFTHRKDGKNYYESIMHHNIDEIYRACQGEVDESKLSPKQLEELEYAEPHALDEYCVKESARPIKRAIRQMLNESRAS